MDNKVSQLIEKMNKLLDDDDAFSAWDMQDEIQHIRNSLPPYSAARDTIDEIWSKMMIQWH